jgi:hypothetical protein
VRPLNLDDLRRCAMSAHGPIMITPIVRLVSVTTIVVRKVLGLIEVFTLSYFCYII